LTTKTVAPLVPRSGSWARLKPSVGRLRRGEKNRRGHCQGQEALPHLGGRRAKTGSPIRGGTGLRQRVQALGGAACVPPRQGQEERGACDVVRPAGPLGQAAGPPRHALVGVAGPQTAWARVAYPGRRRGRLPPHAWPRAVPPLCSGVWPCALAARAGGPRGSRLAGRGGWRETEDAEAGASPTRHRREAGVSGQAAGSRRPRAVGGGRRREVSPRPGPGPAPNQGLHLTASSLRSCLAPASGRR
jgi:hypothetical protein